MKIDNKKWLKLSNLINHQMKKNRSISLDIDNSPQFFFDLIKKLSLFPLDLIFTCLRKIYLLNKNIVFLLRKFKCVNDFSSFSHLIVKQSHFFSFLLPIGWRQNHLSIYSSSFNVKWECSMCMYIYKKTSIKSKWRIIY